MVFFNWDNRHYENINGKITDIKDEIPFEIPDSWAWCRLTNVIELLSGQDLTPNRYNDKKIGIPYITGASNLENCQVVENRWTDSPTFIQLLEICF